MTPKAKPAPTKNGKPAPALPQEAKPKPRKPSPKRLATALGRKLLLIDREQTRLTDDPDYSSSELYKLDKKKNALIKDAKKAGLNLISIQVADGSALYWEAKRTKTQITFEWLNTGGDLYMSGFGKVVSVPLAQGQKLIKQFKPSEW